MIYEYQIPSEYRSCSYWERAIGVIDAEGGIVNSAKFVPSAPMYPETHGGCYLLLRAVRGGAFYPIGQIYLTKKKLEAFAPFNFEIFDTKTILIEGDVLVLGKENMKTKGMSLPDSLVQVEICL